MASGDLLASGRATLSRDVDYEYFLVYVEAVITQNNINQMANTVWQINTNQVWASNTFGNILQSKILTIARFLGLG